MYLLLAVRSHWKPEGWWAKRSRGHLAFRIFWIPTHPGTNRSRLSPMTDSILWVTTRSDETRFSWNSIDKPDFGCKCKEGTRSLFNLYCQTQKLVKNVPLFLHLKKKKNVILWHDINSWIWRIIFIFNPKRWIKNIEWCINYCVHWMFQILYWPVSTSC